MPEILTYALLVAVFALAGNDTVAASTASARFVWTQHAGNDAASGDESGKGGGTFDSSEAYGGESSEFVGGDGGGDGDGEADRGGADSGNSDADGNLTDGDGDNN